MENNQNKKPDRTNIIKEKSFAFALAIISFTKQLKKDKEYEIASQLMRSGTSIGANISEAQYAVSKKDFIHKMQIALKEAYETAYWIEIISVSTDFAYDTHELTSKIKQIVALLIAIIKTCKK